MSIFIACLLIIGVIWLCLKDHHFRSAVAIFFCLAVVLGVIALVGIIIMEWDTVRYEWQMWLREPHPVLDSVFAWVFVLGLGWFLLEWLKEAGPRWRWVQNLSEAYHKRKAENEDAPKEEVRKEEDDTPRPASLGYGTMQQ